MKVEVIFVNLDAVSNKKDETKNQERREEIMENNEAKKTVIQNIIDNVKQLLENDNTFDSYFVNMEIPQFATETTKTVNTESTEQKTTSEPEVNEDVLLDNLNIMVDDVWALDDDLVRVVKIINDKEIEVMFEDFSTCIVNKEEFADEWDYVGRAVYPYTLLKEMALDVR